MFNLSKEQLEEIKKIFSNPNELNNLEEKMNTTIKKIMDKTQCVYDNRKMIEKVLLEGFALTGIMKKDIAENNILNGENSLNELKAILGHLLTNQIILSAEIYRLCFKNDKKTE